MFLLLTDCKVTLDSVVQCFLSFCISQGSEEFSEFSLDELRKLNKSTDYTRDYTAPQWDDVPYWGWRRPRVGRSDFATAWFPHGHMHPARFCSNVSLLQATHNTTTTTEATTTTTDTEASSSTSSTSSTSSNGSGSTSTTSTSDVNGDDNATTVTATTTSFGTSAENATGTDEANETNESTTDDDIMNTTTDAAEGTDNKTNVCPAGKYAIAKGTKCCKLKKGLSSKCKGGNLTWKSRCCRGGSVPCPNSDFACKFTAWGELFAPPGSGYSNRFVRQQIGMTLDPDNDYDEVRDRMRRKRRNGGP